MLQNIQAHYGLAQISNSLSRNWGEIVRKILFYSILILLSQRSMASQAAGEVAAAVPVDFYAASMGVVACVGAGVQVYSAGKDIITHTFPDEEKQVVNCEVNKKIALSKAKSEFKHCLIKNKLSVERGSSAISELCEEVALILIRCGGEKEVNEITAIFNERRKAK